MKRATAKNPATPKATPVRALGHPAATRTNIPTAELESFARPEEKRPATVRYPRDPTLDPEVPAVPIYIGETSDRRCAPRWLSKGRSR